MEVKTWKDGKLASELDSIYLLERRIPFGNSIVLLCIQRIGMLGIGVVESLLESHSLLAVLIVLHVTVNLCIHQGPMKVVRSQNICIVQGHI